MLRSRLVCLLTLWLSSMCLFGQQQPINNDSVVQMTRAGLGDSLIIQSINMTPSNFSTSASDLISLKQAGVSERVIGAMVAKNGAPAVPATTATTARAAGPAAGSGTAADGRMRLDMGDPPPEPVSPVPSDLALQGVEELGVYYKMHDGKWLPMDPELVNFRSGGALKSYGTYNVIKQDKNGHLMGPTAQLALTKDAKFLLYMPSGTAPVEFLLLKLRPGAQKSREFRSETGGVFHSSTGAERDRVVFNATRITSRIYEFNLPADVAKGEYGILPPTSAANAGMGGKIFTFKIVE